MEQCCLLYPFNHLHLVVNFLSLQICNIVPPLVFFRAERGRFAKNPMHKLFSVNSEAETLKILLALHFPLTMVRCSKGGRKVFLPILHLLPYDLLFKGWS